MERELWRRIRAAIRRLPRTRARNAVYTWEEVLAVLLWAALHDRSISWACRRSSWPMQAWRRRLPDQSTMSRRLRDPEVPILLTRVLQMVQEDGGSPVLLVFDGKPLELSEYTRDPEARAGRGAGRMAMGYKLHLILEPQRQAVRAWEVHPLNRAEPEVAADLVDQACTGEGGVLLADSLVDSNPLHQRTGARRWQLITPRKRPGTGLGRRVHHPHRLLSVLLTEGPLGCWDRDWAVHRDAIERFFGALASFGGGLFGLPPWARRLHRVRYWVGAKLVVNAARIARARNAVAA